MTIASISVIGRSDGIRTHDPLTPSQVRYQTAPHSVTCNYYIVHRFSKIFKPFFQILSFSEKEFYDPPRILKISGAGNVMETQNGCPPRRGHPFSTSISL